MSFNMDEGEVDMAPTVSMTPEPLLVLDAAELEVSASDVQFGVVDYSVFVMMLMVSMGVGVYSAVKARNNFTVSEFLFGGQQMPALPVALSLLGGVISALSILGNATEIYLYGTQIVVNLLGAILGVYVLHNYTLPIFFNLNLVSVVQYLELRYESGLLRRLATVCQLLNMFFYLGVCLYAPSLALASVTKLPMWASCVVLGVICSIYVSIGGVRAVVYTDVLQTLLMFAGVVIVVAKVCVYMGGVHNVWDIAKEGGRLEFFNLDPSPLTRHTFWSCGVLGFYFILSTVGFSQPQYQRFASVKNINSSKWLLKFFLVGLFVLWGLFYFSGLVAYASYKDCDPLTSGRIEKPDQIIPYLVMDKLGTLPGLPGLFVAAVYGGVLSSMSSQANSIACLVWQDLLKDTRFFSKVSETPATTIVKCITACAGLVSVGLALLVSQLGTLFSVAYAFSGAIIGPLDGLFVAGIFLPWVNYKGAIVGLVTSFTLSMWRVVGKMVVGGGIAPYLPLSTAGCPENLYNNITTTFYTNISTPLPPNELPGGNSIYDISYCYNGVLGILTTVIVCSIVSLFTSPHRPGELDPLLVNPASVRLYRNVWGGLAILGITTKITKKEADHDDSCLTSSIVQLTTVNSKASVTTQTTPPHDHDIRVQNKLAELL